MKKKISIVVLLCCLLLTLLLSACSQQQSGTAATVATDSLFEQKLATYQRAIVEQYAAVQPGDVVLLQTPVYLSEQAAVLTEICYERGASAVYQLYTDQTLNAINRNNLTQEALADYIFPQALQVENLYALDSYVYLALVSPLFGEKVKTEDKAAAAYAVAKEEYLNSVLGHGSSRADNRTCWTAVAMANENWAQHLRPELSGEEALAALWDDIFDFARISDEQPEVSGFAAHAEQLTQTRDYLNGLKITALHFEAAGTDLTVELHKNHCFAGGGEEYEGRIYYPNVPSEECYTMPDKYGVNGTVQATKPLDIKGVSVENMKLTFKDGKVTDYSADAGAEVLALYLEKEGNRYLGEAALVPQDSIVAAKGLVFGHMLLDENAGCHLALGNSYECNLLPGSEPDDHVNTSTDHADFVFGSDDLQVTATLADGSEQLLLEKGRWTF